MTNQCQKLANSEQIIANWFLKLANQNWIFGEFLKITKTLCRKVYLMLGKVNLPEVRPLKWKFVINQNNDLLTFGIGLESIR